MLSEKDFEKLWFLYKMEGAPKNVAIEDFCKSQGVNPSVFTKWLKMRERRIEPENDPNAEEMEESKSEKGEKEERPNRKGMTYKKGCNETNVIKHYSDKSKLPAGYKLYSTTWQSVYTKVELVIEHKIEILHYMDAEGKMHTTYIPIEDEYADIDSLKGTMLDWDELTRLPER